MKRRRRAGKNATSRKNRRKRKEKNKSKKNIKTRFLIHNIILSKISTMGKDKFLTSKNKRFKGASLRGKPLRVGCSAARYPRC